MLVKESEANKEELVEAIRNKDRMRIKEIIHRMFPMWEMLGIAEELQEYRNLVHDDSSGDQIMKEWTLKITASLDRLVSAAENEIYSLIRQENEKEILIVEDNVALSQLQRDWLERCGYAVTTAMDEPAAKEY